MSSNVLTALVRRHQGTFRALADYVLTWEGGYSNDPSDSGGETVRGVTWGTFQELGPVLGFPLNRQTFLSLQPGDVALFLAWYWNKAGSNEVSSPGVAAHLADLRWGGGGGRVSWCVKEAFRFLGMEAPDISGAVTPEIGRRIDRAGPAFFDALWRARMAYYDRIIQRNPQNEKFRKGWTRRASDFYKRFRGSAARKFPWAVLLLFLFFLLMAAFTKYGGRLRLK